MGGLGAPSPRGAGGGLTAHPNTVGWVPPDPDGSPSQSPDHAQSLPRGLAPLFPPRSAKSPRCRALRAVPCALRVPPLTPLLFPQTRAARTSPSPWWQKDWPPAGKGSEPTSTYVAVPPAPGSGSAPRGSAVGFPAAGRPPCWVHGAEPRSRGFIPALLGIGGTRGVPVWCWEKPGRAHRAGSPAGAVVGGLLRRRYKYRRDAISILCLLGWKLARVAS